jgi:uncharacterized membrane protein (GlpM family)
MELVSTATRNAVGKMNIKRLENAHVAFWLLKDFSWCSGMKWLGLLMVFPTLALAIRLAYSSRNNREDWVHSIAIVFWICANITWMIGEFFFEDHTRWLAQVFFMAGLGAIGSYYFGCGCKFVYRWVEER